MTTLAFASLLAVLVIFAAVIGVAICSHFDSGFFEGDDRDIHP